MVELNLFVFSGVVRSSPVILKSGKTGNQFVKFTVCIQSDLPMAYRQKLMIEKHEKPENFGDVFIDCFVSQSKYGASANYVLKNVHVRDRILAKGKISSGKKPSIDEIERYRTNWVYGDSLYCQIEDIKIIGQTEKVRTWNPYKKWDKGQNSEINDSEHPNVDDNDIKFTL